MLSSAHVFLRAALIVSGCLLFWTPVVSSVDCGGYCGTNNDCTSLECSRCVNNTCVVGQSCGNGCLVTTDCNQASNCTLCNQGVCGRGCGQPCNTTKECVAYGCNQCLYNQCVLWMCNMFCTSDAPCVVGGYGGCGSCDQRNPSVFGTCKSTCGDLCNSDEQCPARCPFCVGGRCGVTQP